MAQTPQVFRRSLIMEAYASQDLRGVTDDSQVVEGFGVTRTLLKGIRPTSRSRLSRIWG